MNLFDLSRRHSDRSLGGGNYQSVVFRGQEANKKKHRLEDVTLKKSLKVKVIGASLDRKCTPHAERMRAGVGGPEWDSPSIVKEQHSMPRSSSLFHDPVRRIDTH